jgi:fatty acid desaturase
MTSSAAQLTLTPTQVVRSLPGGGGAEPRTLVAWALFDWSVIGLGWLLILVPEAVVLRAAGIVIVASRLHALGVILHDACHRLVRYKTATWWAVEALAGWPIASTIEAMRYHHLRHHRDAGMRTDPYWHPLLQRGHWARVLLTLRGALLPFWWTLRAFVAPFALLVPRLRTVYGRAFLQDRSGQDLSDHPELLRCARADLAQAAAHCAAAAAIVMFELPFVSCYLLPWMLGGIMNAHRVIIEHAPEENHDRSLATVLATTRNHDLGRLANALLYPHHIGLHQAHHFAPAAAFVHLPAVAALIRGESPSAAGRPRPR